MQRTALQHAPQHATCNGRHCNMQKRQDVTEIQRATVSIAPCGNDRIPNSRCNRQLDRLQRSPLQHATDRIATCNRRHCNLQKRQGVTEIQRATVSTTTGGKDEIPNFRCNKQQDGMQRTALQHAPVRVATRNFATCCFSLQHAALLQHATRNTHNG